MGTLKRESTSRPRSLADDLRLRSDEQLEFLLSKRPDLVHPVPADISQLAVRATTGPSVSAALDGLNQLQLSVCQALAGLPDPSSRDDVHRGLHLAVGYTTPAVDSAIDHLLAIALVWGADDDLHLIRVARESFGTYACGLAGSFSQSRRTVREYGETPALVHKVLSEAPPEAQSILEQLLWDNPSGTMRQANRAVRPEEVRSPLDWLLSRELIVPVGDTTVVVPREVALALRGGQLLQTVGKDSASAARNTINEDHRDSLGAHSALDVVRLVETLLEEWSLEPPTQLRGGGLAIRDLAGVVNLLKVDEHSAALVVELSYAAGLVGSDSHEGWVPTSAYDRWLALDDARRWEHIATTWRDSSRAAHIVGGDGGERINALTTGVERSFIAPLRMTVLNVLSDLDQDAATDTSTVIEYLDWHRPRRASAMRAGAVAAILKEAALLGVTSMDSLTTFGRNIVLDSGQAAAALSGHLPAPVDHIIVQADLTALAPGRLLAVPRRTMAVLAEVESTGVATSYRFSETSIRRALDQGQSAHEILDFLKDLSKTPLPQPLTYLVEDVARKHGVLRVGVASIYLRCDDQHLIDQVQADRRLASLQLRQIAPGIVVSASPADVVLDKLRDAGYAPVAESAQGAVLIHRPETKRTSAKPAASAVTITGPSPRLITVAVKALRAGERVEEHKPESGLGPRATSTETMALLNEALLKQREVWIGYADKSGMTTERIVEPLSITAGFLTAFDVRNSEVHTFTISRITGATYVEDSVEGSAS
jgi:Helicase conserved C-terminal domain